MIRSVCAIAMTAFCLSWAGQTSAQQQQERDRGNERRAELSRSVRSIERTTGARVVSAERVSYGDDELHRIKTVDDDGRVRTFIQHPERREDDSPRSQQMLQDDDGDPAR